MSNIQALDEKYIWHPFTQAKTADMPIAIQSAKGAHLYDYDGKSYVDLISSWWTNLHGHAHPQIAQSIHDQALKLEHVIFGGFTHEPAAKLCENLASILPPNLNRFFFSDNGSSAVEVALKMAHQYWKNIGQNQRKIFLSLEGGYHGDTFGAMALGNSSGFHKQFADLFFEVKHIPFPNTWNGDEDVFVKEKHALNELEKCLKQFASLTVAMLAEPLIQGAAGMRICRPEFVNAAVNMIKGYGIPIIFDEVMTGFGRTGTNFASDQLDVTPDMICLSKGLTGGFLPLSLTVVAPHIYEAFLSEDASKTFLHGHSYTANPLGCAAANASFKLLMNDHTQAQIKLINHIHHKRMDEFNHPIIMGKRVLGTISAFNLGSLKSDYNYHNVAKLKRLFLEAGLLVRPLGNAVYFLPPYCISAKDLNASYDKVFDIISKSYS